VRIVADTNVIVSAFLWGGVPRQLLNAAEGPRVELFTSRALIAELEDVLSRGKFAVQLSESRFTSAYLLARYTQLATLIAPVEVTAPELRDPTMQPSLPVRSPSKPISSSPATSTCETSRPTGTSRSSTPPRRSLG